MKLVIQSMSRVWGGNEKWLSIVAKGLSGRGHEVIVSCPSGKVRERLESMGIVVTGVRPRGGVDVVSGLSFALWLRRVKPDALLLTSWHSIAWSTLAARVAGVHKVVVRQGIVRDFPGASPRSYALRHGVTDVIVNSPEIKEVWARSTPEVAGRIHVVMNAVPSTRPKRNELRARLRSELGIGDSEILFGGAGNLFARKGFDVLLEAFADADIDGSRLAIIGDGDERSQLEALGARLGIADKVFWLGRRDNAPELIAGLDAFVLSSQNEGMANVMLEAMAAGTPVIAFDISGVRTALGAEAGSPEAGWMIDPGDKRGLSRAMREVAAGIDRNDSELRDRVNEAHWRIEHRFSEPRMLDECEAILFNR